MMNERLIKLNYVVLTFCYIFGSFYLLQGFLLRSPKLTLMKLPFEIQNSLQKILVILGANSILIISVGCHAMRGKSLFLAWHAVSSTVILAGLIATSVYLITQLQTISDIIHSDMRELIDTYDLNPSHRVFIDSFQIQNKCCGIDSIDDWLPLGRVPISCVIPTFNLNSQNSSELKIKENASETILMNQTYSSKEIDSRSTYTGGCYLPYKQLILMSFIILILTFIFNSLLLGISIFIESFLFVETALKEEEQCNAAMAASREEQRQIIRQRNRTGKIYRPAPTQYDAAYENIEFTESEENIVYPKSKLRKLVQKLFIPRKTVLRRDQRRRVLNREEYYENAMIHWLYYF